MKNAFNYIISTDSGCDLSFDVLKEHNIEAINLTYTAGEESIKDEMNDETTKLFYNKIRKGKCFKTSAANIFEAYYYLKRLTSLNPNIIHICLGSKISSTYTNFIEAMELLKEDTPHANIYIIDSSLASVGYGMLCLEASLRRDEGASMDEVLNFIESTKHHIMPYYTTDTLKYLYQGGRVSKGKMVIGNMLSIKPILRLNYDGQLKVCAKARGIKSATMKIIQYVKDNVINPSEQTLYVCHADNLELAKKIGEQVYNELKFKNIFYTLIGPTIGSHAGPGLVAVFFKGKERTH